MTRKDYVAAAKIVREYKDSHPFNAGLVVENAFADFFAEDNSRFDEARFRAACVPSNEIKV
jgi:hypothetical protein